MVVIKRERKREREREITGEDMEKRELLYLGGFEHDFYS
jgi:hypothetical protein